MTRCHFSMTAIMNFHSAKRFEQPRWQPLVAPDTIDRIDPATIVAVKSGIVNLRGFWMAPSLPGSKEAVVAAQFFHFSTCHLHPAPPLSYLPNCWSLFGFLSHRQELNCTKLRRILLNASLSENPYTRVIIDPLSLDASVGDRWSVIEISFILPIWFS